MDDGSRGYEKFLDALSSLADEMNSSEPDEDSLSELASQLGPLSDGMVALLAEKHARNPDEKLAIKEMELDEALAYLADRLHPEEVMDASHAAAGILAARRWLHYGSFARPDDEETIEFGRAAVALEKGLERLLGRFGGRSSG